MKSVKVFASARSRRTALIAAPLVLTLLAGLSWAVGRSAVLTDPVALRAWLLEFGLLAPVVFVLLQAAQIIIAPIPGQFLGLVSGYLFGTLLGTAYSLLGATIGTWIALRLARRYGRPFVDRLLEPEFVARFDGLAADRGIQVMFLVFLVPGIPDDAICFVAGVTDLNIRRLLAASIFGRLPGYLLTNMAGDSLAGSRYTEAVVLLVLFGLAAVLGFYYRDRVFARLNQH
ncbi:MAG: TVP38/TMEM64 family protein [Halodesulfurarchaeum sp.]